MFKTLLSEPRFAAVLQFYAGFTKLINQGVRNIITGSDFTYEESSRRSLLNYVRCFYEAQIDDQSLYSNFFSKAQWNTTIVLCYFESHWTVCLLDTSWHWFVGTVENLRVNISKCGVNDHSIALMMGELSKHVEACPAGALHGVTVLKISSNNIGDKGIALISTALQTNTTMTNLIITACNMSDDGAESLARALTVNKTLQEIYVRYNNISGHWYSSY